MAAVRRRYGIRGEFADGIVLREKGSAPALPIGKWWKPAKIAAFFSFFTLERLTVTAAEPYIGPLGRAAASARWRVREAPHCLHGDRASGHAHGHVRVGVSNARGLWAV